MSTVEVDSSSDEESEYRTTNTTLGYASLEPTGDDISHIGGHPVSLVIHPKVVCLQFKSWIDTENAPPAVFARCKVCNGLISLLLQLNAHLQHHFPNDDRRLHVLCCRKKACSKKPGSIRAFREVKKPAKRSKEKKASELPKDEAPKQDLGSALFGGAPMTRQSPATNPFSTLNGGQTQRTNPFSPLPPVSSLAAKLSQQPVDNDAPPIATFAEQLRISSPTETPDSSKQEPWPAESEFPPPFPRLYLDADAEELETEGKQEETHAGSSRSKYEVDDSTGTAIDKDTFESTLDKAFQKFSDRISQNSEQVLRYEFKGQPLLYSGSDGVASRFVVPHGKAGAIRGMPRCERCSAQRVFELQLVPGLIFELEKDEAMDLEDGMEWGTIIVGSCSNNCGESGEISFREEWVGVQWEERTVKS